MTTINKIVLKYYHGVSNMKFSTHLILSLIIRFVLIVYGEWQDIKSEVPFTDIDYKVVTDGARHILKGETPFARHTYRYSPIMAYIHIPNILWHPTFAKVIYSLFDILVAVLIYILVSTEQKLQCIEAVQALTSIWSKKGAHYDCDVRTRSERLAFLSACFWLYNPVTGVISTRGNGDSLTSFLVILTLYLLMKSEDMTNKCLCFMYIVAGGAIHGLTIHLRLYPIFFSLSYFLVLADNQNSSTFAMNLLRFFFPPTLKQLILVVAALVSLLVMNGLFYEMYGWQYIEEAYLYHIIRKDARHNFSLYFLMQYLSSDKNYTPLLLKILIMAPQFILIVYLSFSFGQFRQTLPFASFTIAFVLVTYNSVITSQYFVWYVALISLCLSNFQSIQFRKAIQYFALWLLGQILWLIPAYLLEYKTYNTFIWLGVQCAVYFIMNNFLLATLIRHYSFSSFKMKVKKIS